MGTKLWIRLNDELYKLYIITINILNAQDRFRKWVVIGGKRIKSYFS